MRSPPSALVVRKLKKILREDDDKALCELIRQSDAERSVMRALRSVRAGPNVFEALLANPSMRTGLLLCEIEKNDTVRVDRILQHMEPGKRVLCSESIFSVSTSPEMDDVLIRRGYPMDYSAMAAVMTKSLKRARNFVEKGFDVHTLNENGKSLYEVIYQEVFRDVDIIKGTQEYVALVKATRWLFEKGLPVVKEEVSDYDRMLWFVNHLVF